MSLKLPESIISPQDLTAVVFELRDYARWFSHASTRKKLAAGQPGNPPTVSPAAEALLESWVAKEPLTQQRLAELIESVEDYRQTVPVIKITLAAPAPAALRQELTAWCRANIKDDILVSFNFNATLLGGMVVTYGSRIFDWSFRRQIMAARGSFPEVLRRV